MPLYSPWPALFLAALMLWPPATRRWALVPLAVAWALAWKDGVIEPVALAAPALLALAAVCIRPTFQANSPATPPPALRLFGHLLFVLLAAALFLHLIPGFYNPQVIAPAPLSADAVAFGMYLNLDKPLVAFWVILVLAPPMVGGYVEGYVGADAGRALGSDARSHAGGNAGGIAVHIAGRTLAAALLACAAAVLVSLGLALALGVVGWAPKWPDTGWIWLINNALLVTVAEEALFRGYVQQQLATCWRNRRWGGWAALGVAALLFGLAHFAGGWQWMLLATMAGVAYGVAYRYGGLAAAVLAHLGLNAAHFGLFTYPMRAVF